MISRQLDDAITERMKQERRQAAPSSVDLTPDADGYARVGACFASDLIQKTREDVRGDAAAILTSLIDIVRYLAVLDARDGTAYLQTLRALARLDGGTR